MCCAVHAGAEWQVWAEVRQTAIVRIGWIGKKVSREDVKARRTKEDGN
jgi:hypothetical protein